jgi:hypothetical protein
MPIPALKYKIAATGNDRLNCPHLLGRRRIVARSTSRCIPDLSAQSPALLMILQPEFISASRLSISRCTGTGLPSGRNGGQQLQRSRNELRSIVEPFKTGENLASPGPAAIVSLRLISSIPVGSNISKVEQCLSNQSAVPHLTEVSRLFSRHPLETAHNKKIDELLHV